MAILPSRQAVIQKVLDKQGGLYSAAAALGIEPAVVQLYIIGKSPIPDAVVLRAIDVVFDEPEQKPLLQIRI